MFLIIFPSVEVLDVKSQEVPENMASTRDISKVPTEILFAIFQSLPLTPTFFLGGWFIE